ncbi:MAG: hypothetical protein AAFO94_03325 [Bacteroidota bacterium]
MNNVVLRNASRLLLLILLQAMVLKRLVPDYGLFVYIHIIIYPIFILLLPVKTPQALAVLLGFFLGLLVDIFYDSIGVHASACVFTAFIRPYVLNFMAPRTGYTVNQTPTRSAFGFNWFFGYSSFLLFAHLFFYFSVEAFTFVYIGDIFLRTFFSFVVSMFFVLAWQYIFDPK